MADWTLNGNADTDPETKFLGTTDNQPLSIRTNGIEAIRVDPGKFEEIDNTNEFTSIPGNVGVGTALPLTRLHVVGDRIRLSDLGAGRVLDLRADGGAVDVQSDTSSLFVHSNGSAGNNHVLINPFPDEGNVGIGTVDPRTKLDVNGAATVEILHITGGGDMSERFAVASNTKIEPGTVMVIDENCPGNLKISDTAYDRKVAGIVSGAGGIKTGAILRSSPHIGGYPIALAGCVYSKGDATSHPIQTGDPLTTSAIPGHAMKVVDTVAAQGAILGKAMSPLYEGTGLVLVLANLQ